MKKVKDIIVFEGMQGCGKTTIANKEILKKQLLSNDYYKDYHNVINLRCPGDGIAEVRNLIRTSESELDNYTYMCLSLADMNELVKKSIQPLSNEGNIIILDRCFHSTFVYQDFTIYNRTSAEIISEHVMNIFGHDLLDRMITFILDVPYEIYKTRRNYLNDMSDTFEKKFEKDEGYGEKFFNEKRKKYLNFALCPYRTAKMILQDVFILNGTIDINYNIANVMMYLNIINDVRRS